MSETPATFHAATFHAAPSPLGRGGQSIFGAQFGGTAAERQAGCAAAMSTAFPSFGGVPVEHTAPQVSSP